MADEDEELEPDPDDFFEDGASEPTGPTTRRPRGTLIGAAMLGLEQAIFGKVKQETVVEIETSGDPPNIDLDGLDTSIGPDHRLVGPPLDSIKDRARRRRRHR